MGEVSETLLYHSDEQLFQSSVFLILKYTRHCNYQQFFRSFYSGDHIFSSIITLVEVKLKRICSNRLIKAS
jgi:hypothetical protein